MKKLFFMIGFMTLASSSWATITIDSSSGTFVATGNISYSHTVNAASAMCYVCFADEGTAAPTGATFGGNAMTLVSSSTVYDYTFLYKYANPSAGANTIAITWTNTVPAAAASLCFTGVNTGSDLDAQGRGTGTTSPTSDSVVVNTATDATIDCLFADPEVTAGPVPTGGQKIKVGINDAVNGQGLVFSTASYTSTGTKTLTYTYTGSVQWTALSRSIAVAAGGTTGVSLNRGLAITGGKTDIIGGETVIK